MEDTEGIRLLLPRVVNAKSRRRTKVDGIMRITRFAREECPHLLHLGTADVAFLLFGALGGEVAVPFHFLELC